MHVQIINGRYNKYIAITCCDNDYKLGENVAPPTPPVFRVGRTQINKTINDEWAIAVDKNSVAFMKLDENIVERAIILTDVRKGEKTKIKKSDPYEVVAEAYGVDKKEVMRFVEESNKFEYVPTFSIHPSKRIVIHGILDYGFGAGVTINIGKNMKIGNLSKPGNLMIIENFEDIRDVVFRKKRTREELLEGVDEKEIHFIEFLQQYGEVFYMYNTLYFLGKGILLAKGNNMWHVYHPIQKNYITNNEAMLWIKIGEVARIFT